MSFYVVEQPIREGRVPWLRRSPAHLALAAPVALGLAVFVAVRATTLPTSPELGQHLDVELAVALADHSDKECPKPENVTFSWCVRHQGAADRPVVATIGDSMARALGPGLDAEGDTRDFTFIQAAWGGCTISGIAIPQINLMGITPYDVTCHDEAVSTVEAMIDSAHPDVLLMTEHTAVFSRLRVDDRWVPPLSDEHDRVLADGYVAVFGRFLRSVDQIVLIETNQDGLRVGCTARPANKTACSPPPNEVEAVEHFNDVLHRVAARFPGRVSVVSVADLVCPGGTCVAIRDYMLIRYDGQHYTATFSRWLMPQLLDRVGAATGVRI